MCSIGYECFVLQNILFPKKFEHLTRTHSEDQHIHTHAHAHRETGMVDFREEGSRLQVWPIHDDDGGGGDTWWWFSWWWIGKLWLNNVVIVPASEDF